MCLSPVRCSTAVFTSSRVTFATPSASSTLMKDPSGAEIADSRSAPAPSPPSPSSSAAPPTASAAAAASSPSPPPPIAAAFALAASAASAALAAALTASSASASARALRCAVLASTNDFFDSSFRSAPSHHSSLSAASTRCAEASSSNSTNTDPLKSFEVACRRSRTESTCSPVSFSKNFFKPSIVESIANGRTYSERFSTIASSSSRFSKAFLRRISCCPACTSTSSDSAIASATAGTTQAGNADSSDTMRMVRMREKVQMSRRSIHPSGLCAMRSSKKRSRGRFESLR
mmetsp:Transcript_10049/g.32968  ORF Transcript_10049/g.32968 Transcript_10049/m.32968 type:complete len:290 (+) Transcript_10049:242-1111(+)